MEKGDPCPFGVCREGEVREIAISTLCSEVSDVHKAISMLSSRVRTLQVIVVGGVVIDFLVNSRAGQAAVAFIGR